MKFNSSLNRRAFLKTLGAAAATAPFVTRGLMAQSPNSILHHASFGSSGMAWSDINEIAKFKNVRLVAVADVDLRLTKGVRNKFPRARIYQDWRELLDREGKHLDSVNVTIPDHMHADAEMTAMNLGKNIYGQKPMAHDLYEVRRLTHAAKEKRLVTQMGIQIQASQDYRCATALVHAAVIGKVKEVHSWCPKSWGDPSPRPDRSDPIPKGFEWNKWLGVCQPRPFIGHGYYHQANWRKRIDFGTGTFGDMGCHIFDPVFTSLKLTAPISIRSEGLPPNKWNWALNSLIHYVFPGTPYTAEDTVRLTWYDGDQKPPAEIRALLEGDDLPNTGSIFVGTEGTMVLPHWARPMLYPDRKFRDMKYPQVKGGDHWGAFVEACLTGSPTGANYGYAGPLTESVIMGCVACRFPKTTLKWDAPNLRFDLSEANQFIRRTYREGWGAPGLV